MRVVLTIPSTSKEFGGPFTKAMALAGSLRSVGLDVEVVGAGPATEYKHFISLGAVGRFHATPVPRSIRPLTTRITSADVVHILGYRDPVGTVAGLSAKRGGVLFILEPCGMHRRRLRSGTLKKLFDRGIGDRVFAMASRIVATSSLERTELIEGGVDPERIELRPNGIDIVDSPSQEKRGPFRHRHGIPPRVPLVLFLGRIARGKGLEFLLRAVSQDRGLHTLIAGPDSRDGTLATLGQRISSLSLEDRVTINASGFWGKDKIAALAASDVFCLPSAGESFGTAAAEAAGMGLPVVLAEGCGVSEYLPPETTRVVRFEDAGSLAASLAQMAIPEMRAAARMRSLDVRETLNWDAVAKVQLEIYQDVLRQT